MGGVSIGWRLGHIHRKHRPMPLMLGMDPCSTASHAFETHLRMYQWYPRKCWCQSNSSVVKRGGMTPSSLSLYLWIDEMNERYKSVYHAIVQKR